MSAKVDRSKFDLSHEVKTTMEFGKLTPIFFQEVVPNDIIKVSTSSLIRFLPLVRPYLHRVNFKLSYFYVPWRLVCKDWVEILTNPDTLLKTPNIKDFWKVTAPVELTGNTLFDYFGINSHDRKIMPENLRKMSAMPFMAYHLIYNYFFRDPLLDTEYKDEMKPDDLAKVTSPFALYNVNWTKDYFTSAYTTTQYGTEVDIDLDGNNTIKVNELRLAERLQRWKEKVLLAANRYISYMGLMHKADPRDYSLARPKFLGSIHKSLNVSDVDQMVGTDAEPLGNVAGKSLTVLGDDGFKASFDEHGIVLGLATIMPETSYSAGVPRIFLEKEDSFGFYNPLFASLAMQEVLPMEVNAGADSDTAWAYQGRYEDLKTRYNIVCGEFTHALKPWHFGRNITEEHFGNNFVRCYPSLDPFAYRGYLIDDIKVVKSSDSRTIVVFFGAKENWLKIYEKSPELKASNQFSEESIIHAINSPMSNMIQAVQYKPAGGIFDFATISKNSPMTNSSTTVYPIRYNMETVVNKFRQVDGEAPDDYGIWKPGQQKSTTPAWILDKSDIHGQSSLTYKSYKDLYGEVGAQVLSVHYHEVDAYRPMPYNSGLIV